MVGLCDLGPVDSNPDPLLPDDVVTDFNVQGFADSSGHVELTVLEADPEED